MRLAVALHRTPRAKIVAITHQTGPAPEIPHLQERRDAGPFSPMVQQKYQWNLKGIAGSRQIGLEW
jgi:hypothetical protein